MESPAFVSYSRKDYYFAESLALHLLRQGVPVWLDVRVLEPGKDWERSLEEALDAATTVVLVASPDSIGSRMSATNGNGRCARASGSSSPAFAEPGSR